MRQQTGQLDFIRERVKQHGPEYAELLEPAIVERGDDYFVVDTEHEAYIALVARYAPTQEEAAAQAAIEKAAQTKRFHELWEDLHTRRGWTVEQMERFTRAVPCGDCQDHWRGLLAGNPPPYGDDEAMFQWSVFAHDLVNVRLGKPVFPLPSARARWNR